jgi:hypothetical protein
VATIFVFFPLVVIFLFLQPLFKTTEGLVRGFQIFAWAPNINKNSGKKIRFGPPPPGPLGAIFKSTRLIYYYVTANLG